MAHMVTVADKFSVSDRVANTVKARIRNQPFVQDDSTLAIIGLLKKDTEKQFPVFAAFRLLD